LKNRPIEKYFEIYKRELSKGLLRDKIYTISTRQFMKTEKYLQLFNYLLDFAKLLEKVVRKVEDYEECIWFSDIPNEDGYMCITNDNIEDKERADWIIIKKPKELKFPVLPLELSPWVEEESLWNLDKPPALYESIENNGEIIRIIEKPRLQEIYKDYIANYWIPWSIEQPYFKKKADLYKKFFNIFEKSKKFGEEFELVISLGLLYFQTDDSAYIKRHLLVANATMEFFAEKGVFTVSIGADGAKLRVETEMLQDLQFGNISNIHRNLEHELEERELTESPFSEDIGGLLEEFINRLHPKSSYYNTLRFASETPSSPSIFYSPALILRKRTLKSLSTLYQNIIDLIENNTEIDLPLIDDLIESSSEKDFSEINENDIIDELYTDIFFPKVYNDEQIQIIDRLKTRNKILVQGPPGTGKSHTIANLISHLLAHGKTILITAHTKRALTVLKNQLPKEIKPLCVNLLGNDSESINDLESSVINITGKFDVTTLEEYKKTISKSKESLVQSKQKQKTLENKLLNLKELDTRIHDLNDNYKGSMMEIAKKVNDNSEANNWFNDNITDCQTSLNLIDTLISTAQEQFVYKDITNEFDFSLFKEALITVQVLNNSIKSYLKLGEFDSNDFQNLNKNFFKTIKELSNNQIDELEKNFIELLEIKKGFQAFRLKWSSKAIDESLNGFSNYWIEIYETTTKMLNKEFKSKVEFFEKSHKFNYSQNISIQQLNADTRLFIKHLESGKSIRKIKFLNNKEIKERWYLTSEVFVNGSRCDTIEEFRLLNEYTNSQLEIEYLQKIWADKIEVKESKYLQFLEIEKNRLELERIIENSIGITDLKMRILKVISESDFSLEQEFLNNVLNTISYHRLTSEYEEYKQIKDELLNQLKQFNKKKDAHKIFLDVQKAIETGDVLAYEQYLEKIKSIKIEFEKYNSFKETKELLIEYFPVHVNLMTQNFFDLSHYNSRELRQAIVWSYAKNFVNSHLQSNAYGETLDDLKDLENVIAHTTSVLASERAWYFLFNNMSTQHRKHLVAWFQAIRKIGKGTGKNAWKFRKEAQKQMDECRTAIPAWIMPLYRITETIKPIPGMFDYVIIDEASQAGPDALFLLFIAKKIIIVGDDKQTAPEYIGIPIDNVEQLLAKHLKNFPFANFYGLGFSFYDLAKIFIESGGGKVTLREHFRCMPEIIEFSNKNFYEPFGNSLFPLKQYSEKRLDPIKTTYVADGYSEGTSAVLFNMIEAKEICDTIGNCMNEDKYRDKTMGVISLRGTNQAQRIEKMLLDRFGPEELEKRKIICGNSANFQGDERDIIFLSMVIDGKKNFRALSTEADKRRFNVAASRAKEQIWLFHSVRLDELNNKEDLRYLMLDYYLNPKTFIYPIVTLPKKFEYDKTPPHPFGSWFEVEIYNDLTKLGYRLVPQYPVSKYRIDLGVVFPHGSKVAIECDGDKFHGIDEYQNDIMRQKVLERCGWQFIRIRGCEYYSDKVNTIRNVVETLSDLGYEKMKFGDEIKKESSYLNDESEHVNNENKNARVDNLRKINVNSEMIDGSMNLQNEFVKLEAQYLKTLSNNNSLGAYEKAFIYGMGLKRERNSNPSESDLTHLFVIIRKLNNK
jgi:very-short-patch-repair endonuclease